MSGAVTSVRNTRLPRDTQHVTPRDTNHVTPRDTTKMSRKGIFKLRSKSTISRDQAAKWENNFDALINDNKGVQLFTEFARKHHAAENIEFWLAVKEFRKKQLQGDRLNEASRKIYRTFVSLQAEKQININDVIRKDIQKNILAPTMTIFNEAQEKIYILMKTDIYPRFLRDDSYLSLTRPTSDN